MAASARCGTERSRNIPDLVKVTLVKDQEELVLVLETLDGVGEALGEVPDVTVLEGVDLVGAVLVDGGELDASLVDDSPLGLPRAPSASKTLYFPVRLRIGAGSPAYRLVPVQLADGALF